MEGRNKIKVLHLLKTSEGASWAFRLMKELKAHNVEVHVALPKGGRLYSAYSDAGIIVHPMDFSLKKIKSSIKCLRAIVDEVSPDIIHSHFVLTTLVMRLGLRKYKIPRVFEVPGPLHLEHLFTRLIDTKSANREDYWIATCKWTYDRYLKSGIHSHKLFLTYYGSDISYPEYQKGKLRAEYNISEDIFIVGLVAYMYAPKKWLGQKRGLKGHEDFIDALSLIQQKYPNILGVCIGGAWNGATKYEQSIIQYCNDRNVNMIFTGTRRNVGELYQDIDCVVHPSHSENLGGAAESLALGIPTIASNVGGFPDIVLPNKTGLLVPPKNPKALADAIEYMYNNGNEAQKMASNGKKYVSNLLDVKNTSNKVLEFYNSIISHYNETLS